LDYFTLEHEHADTACDDGYFNWKDKSDPATGTLPTQNLPMGMAPPIIFINNAMVVFSE